MNTKDVSFRNQASLANCESEPIHIPGSIQPHGILIALDADAVIRFCSANCGLFFGSGAADLLGKPLRTVHPELDRLMAPVFASREDLERPVSLNQAEQHWDIFACRNSDDLLLIELERSEQGAGSYEDLFDQTAEFAQHIDRAHSLQELCQRIALQTRELTGYDRVMVYRFDEEYNGEVYAEAKADDMESFLNLHYPHTDIPVQARELYLRNLLRMIVDVNYEPVPLLTAADGNYTTPDLGEARLRSVSPIHLQYLKNMGVGATLTISLILEGRLWGLIACHHRGAKHLGYLKRKAALLQGHFLSSQIKVRQVAEEYAVHVQVEAHLQQLLNSLSQEGDFALRFGQLGSLLPVANASGVALLHEGKLYTKGTVPPPERIRSLLSWLAETYSGLQFMTNKLSSVYREGERIAQQAAGILYHRLGDPKKDAIVWFRVEKEQTIHWAGNPYDDIKRSPATNMLTPRTSFALYREQVRFESRPWLVSEVNAAGRFAASLQNSFHLQYLKKEEANQRVLNEKLVKANQELANINWIATHDLKEPIRKILVFASRVMTEEENRLPELVTNALGRIQQSAKRMQSLVDDLMAYRLLDSGGTAFKPVDLNEVLRELTEDFTEDLAEKNIAVLVDELPVLPMIPYQARQLFSNLLGNAIKFTQPGVSGQIRVTCKKARSGSFRHPTRAQTGDFFLIQVHDNGIGFDQHQSKRIFDIFYRLHDAQSYKGTGIGLAICKRIVENHGGFITAESEVNAGAVFSIYLPAEQEHQD